jgi:hypothetical protein
MSLMPLSFKEPEKIPKWQLCQDYLQDWKILDTQDVAWLIFTSSMQKGVIQGAQAFLKQATKSGRLRRFPAFTLNGFEDYRRDVYHLKGCKIGPESPHRLLINKIRTPIELMQRTPHPFGEILYYQVEYHFIREDGRTLPATIEYLDDATEIIPDLTCVIRLPDGGIVVWYIEADTGTEPILAKSPDITDVSDADPNNGNGLASNCLAKKVIRYDRLRHQAHEVCSRFAEFGQLRAILVGFVFQNEGRASRFRKTCLEHFDREMTHIITTNRQQFSDPRDFLSAPIWECTELQPEPFSLLSEDQFQFDDRWALQ